MFKLFKYYFNPRFREKCIMGWDYENAVMGGGFHCTLKELLLMGNEPVDATEIDPEFAMRWKQNRNKATGQLYVINKKLRDKYS